MIETIMLSLRLNTEEFESDIQGYIDACLLDLELTGINKSKIVETDPLIVQAVKCYCKIYVSSDDLEANRYQKSYNLIKSFLATCQEYD